MLLGRLKASKPQGEDILPRVALAAAGCIHEHAIEAAGRQMTHIPAIQAGYQAVPKLIRTVRHSKTPLEAPNAAVSKRKSSKIMENCWKTDGVPWTSA